MLILTQPFEQWTDLKNDLASYRLNSSILVSQPASFGIGTPSTWAESEGIHPRIAFQHPQDTSLPNRARN